MARIRADRAAAGPGASTVFVGPGRTNPKSFYFDVYKPREKKSTKNILPFCCFKGMRKNYDLEVLNYELRASTVSPRLSSEKSSPEIRHENSRPTYLSKKDPEVIKYELLASARSMSPRASVASQSRIQNTSISSSLFNDSRSDSVHTGARKPLNELHASTVASLLSEKFGTELRHENSLPSPQSPKDIDVSSLELLASAISLSPKSSILTTAQNESTGISSAFLNDCGPRYSPEHMVSVKARYPSKELRSPSIPTLPLERLQAISENSLPSPSSSKDFEVLRYEMLALARLNTPRVSTHIKSRELCCDSEHDAGIPPSAPEKSLSSKSDNLDLIVGLCETTKQKRTTVHEVESPCSDCHGQRIQPLSFF